MINNNEEADWGSRRTYMMVLLCQFIGMPIFVGMAGTAISSGPTGYILGYIITSFVVGIPLLYMEFIVSQFTARDSIDIWKVRPCISHIGYILVFWQILNIIYTHNINALLFHYLLITFESPLPYYTCGDWSRKDCNILLHNLTVNKDCIKFKEKPYYCDYLYTTFPEYQYWRYKVLGTKRKDGYHIAWSVCLASGLICAITYLSIFKRKQSVKWVINFFVWFPILGYMLVMMGSLLQKGIVVMYDEALDSDFSVFVENFQLSHFLLQIVFNLGIGTGITFNLTCTNSFRAPCYANSIITVVLFSAAFILATCISAMMVCPYSYEYGISPYEITQAPMSFLYEKTPRLLFEYQHKHFWLVIIYGSHTTLGTGSNIIQMLNLLELVVARSAKVASYPGLTSFFGIVFIFFITIPLLSETGMITIIEIKRYANLMALLVAIVESLVFVIWYGLDRFSEDVHFMQGLQPNSYMRFSWVASVFLLSYSFCEGILYAIKVDKKSSLGDIIGWYLMLATIGLMVFIFCLKLLIAACRKKFNEVLRLDATWGPKSDVLQRSRAMFTAQAMTKEYLYRQYHLQAGILARQASSNCRTQGRELF